MARGVFESTPDEREEVVRCAKEFVSSENVSMVDVVRHSNHGRSWLVYRFETLLPVLDAKLARQVQNKRLRHHTQDYLIRHGEWR